jgi:hypothetical protein
LPAQRLSKIFPKPELTAFENPGRQGKQEAGAATQRLPRADRPQPLDASKQRVLPAASDPFGLALVLPWGSQRDLQYHKRIGDDQLT